MSHHTLWMCLDLGALQPGSGHWSPLHFTKTCPLTKACAHKHAHSLVCSHAHVHARARTHAHTYAHTSVRHVPTPALRLIPKYEIPGSKSKLLEALPTLKAAVEKNKRAFKTDKSGVSE